MNIENNLLIALAFIFVDGLLIGWFATWSHYRLKEVKRKAVEDYKSTQRHQRYTLPLTFEENQRKAIMEVQRFCDSYHITYDGQTWTYQEEEKQTELPTGE